MFGGLNDLGVVVKKVASRDGAPVHTTIPAPFLPHPYSDTVIHKNVFTDDCGRQWVLYRYDPDPPRASNYWIGSPGPAALVFGAQYADVQDKNFGNTNPCGIKAPKPIQTPKLPHEGKKTPPKKAKVVIPPQPLFKGFREVTYGFFRIGRKYRKYPFDPGNPTFEAVDKARDFADETQELLAQIQRSINDGSIIGIDIEMSQDDRDIFDALNSAVKRIDSTSVPADVIKAAQGLKATIEKLYKYTEFNIGWHDGDVASRMSGLGAHRAHKKRGATADVFRLQPKEVWLPLIQYRIQAGLDPVAFIRGVQVLLAPILSATPPGQNGDLKSDLVSATYLNDPDSFGRLGRDEQYGLSLYLRQLLNDLTTFAYSDPQWSGITWANLRGYKRVFGAPGQKTVVY